LAYYRSSANKMSLKFRNGAKQTSHIGQLIGIDLYCGCCYLGMLFLVWSGVAAS